MQEGTPREQQMPGPGQRPARHDFIEGPVEIAASQRFTMSIHDTEGHPFITLREDEDGILQCEGDLSRVSEAAGQFVREVMAMGGLGIRRTPVRPSNLGRWLEQHPFGPVIQPVAVNVMNMAWHAALEAGECNCVSCTGQPPIRQP